MGRLGAFANDRLLIRLVRSTVRQGLTKVECPRVPAPIPLLYCAAPASSRAPTRRGDDSAPQSPRRDARLCRQRRPRRLCHPRGAGCRLIAVLRRRRHRYPLPALGIGRRGTEGSAADRARRSRASQPLRSFRAGGRRERLCGLRHRPSRSRPHAAALGPHRRRRPRCLEPDGRRRNRLHAAPARRASRCQARAVRPQPRLVHGAGLHRAPRRSARCAGAERHVVPAGGAAAADRSAQRRGAQGAARRLGGMGGPLQGLQQAPSAAPQASSG